MSEVQYITTSVNTGNEVLDDYIKKVTKIIQLIDYEQEPSVEFCEDCLAKGINVRVASHQWFDGKHPVLFSLTGQALSVYEFIVTGNRYLRKVIVPQGADDCSHIVIHHGDDELVKAPFRGDVTTSVFSARALWET